MASIAVGGATDVQSIDAATGGRTSPSPRPVASEGFATRQRATDSHHKSLKPGDVTSQIPSWHNTDHEALPDRRSGRTSVSRTAMAEPHRTEGGVVGANDYYVPLLPQDRQAITEQEERLDKLTACLTSSVATNVAYAAGAQQVPATRSGPDDGKRQSLLPLREDSSVVLASSSAAAVAQRDIAEVASNTKSLIRELGGPISVHSLRRMARSLSAGQSKRLAMTEASSPVSRDVHSSSSTAKSPRGRYGAGSEFEDRNNNYRGSGGSGRHTDGDDSNNANVMDPKLMQRWSEDLVQRTASVHDHERAMEDRVHFLRNWELDLQKRQQQLLRRQAKIETAVVALHQRELRLVQLEHAAIEAKRQAKQRIDNGFRVGEQMHRQRLLLQQAQQAEQTAKAVEIIRRRETVECGTMTEVANEYADVVRALELNRRAQLLDERERKLRSVQRISDNIDRRRHDHLTEICAELIQCAASNVTACRVLQNLVAGAAHHSPSAGSPVSSASGTDVLDPEKLYDIEQCVEAAASSAMLCSNKLLTLTNTITSPQVPSTGPSVEVVTNAAPRASLSSLPTSATSESLSPARLVSALALQQQPPHFHATASSTVNDGLWTPRSSVWSTPSLPTTPRNTTTATIRTNNVLAERMLGAGSSVDLPFEML